jgi:hypothetical protein
MFADQVDPAGRKKHRIRAFAETSSEKIACAKTVFVQNNGLPAPFSAISADLSNIAGIIAQGAFIRNSR